MHWLKPGAGGLSGRQSSVVDWVWHWMATEVSEEFAASIITVDGKKED
jgi:hypothetical protein